MPPMMQQAFQTMFPDPDYEDFRFNLLHESVLGLTSLNVEEAYQQRHSMVNEIDRFGRSPLSWAALHGDLKTLQFLIQNGARAEDKSEQNPLSSAVRSGCHRCTELLLNHGADINLKLSSSGYGWNILHTLAACDGTTTKTLMVLLEYGADINALTDLNETPLQYAVYFENMSVASKLLNLGADIHIQDTSGLNAFCVAIQRNCHSILTKFLIRGADHKENIREHGSFLHLVAEHADVTTLRLLANARLATRDILSKRYKDGLTAVDVAKARSGISPAWTTAFQNFLNSVDQTKNPLRTKPEPLHHTLQSLSGNEPENGEEDELDSDKTEYDFVEAPEQQI